MHEEHLEMENSYSSQMPLDPISCPTYKRVTGWSWWRILAETQWGVMVTLYLFIGWSCTPFHMFFGLSDVLKLYSMWSYIATCLDVFYGIFSLSDWRLVWSSESKKGLCRGQDKTKYTSSTIHWKHFKNVVLFYLKHPSVMCYEHTYVLKCTYSAVQS